MRADSPGLLPRVQLIAVLSGCLGLLLAVLVPLLPVRQDRASLDWPQPQGIQVTAPLLQYSPLALDFTIACTTLRDLPGGTVVSTVPPQTPSDKGLLVRIEDRAGIGRTLAVSLRGTLLLIAAIAEITGGSPIPSPSEGEKPAATGLCGALIVHSTAAGSTAELSGLTRPDGTPFRRTIAEDIRPQVVGVYTDLDRAQLGDARLHAEVDSRFSSSPSRWKMAAIAGAVLCTLIALICLHLLDSTDGRRARRFLPSGWWRLTSIDGVVVGILLLWHVIGANTSEDGYLLTMAKASRAAGYTADHYRWFGVAEAPFGWPYEVLAWMTRLSDASLWMRLPALLTGLLCWWVLSREVLPRLGSRIHTNALSHWTTALIFLTIWLPYNNGLRPEPLIALGALLTWCSMERAIATRRLLPAAIAVLITALSLAADPSGLICLAALFAGSRQVLRRLSATRHRLAAISGASAEAEGGSASAAGGGLAVEAGGGASAVRRPLGGGLRFAGGLSRRVGRLGFGRGSADGGGVGGWGVLGLFALVAPVLAAGGLVLVVVFADQGLGVVGEAVRVRRVVGADSAWFAEWGRWESLFSLTPDGALARRFGVLAMLLCWGVCAVVVVRGGGRGLDVARGPVVRVLAMVGMSLLLMTFAPAEWTHHFGVYAGPAAAVAAVVLGGSVIRVRYRRLLFAAAVLLLLAVCFTGSNGWWYVSGYGVVWSNRAPEIAGVGVAAVLLSLAVGFMLVSVRRYFRGGYQNDSGPGRFVAQPLAVVAAALVLFEVVTMAAAAGSRYPAYSVGLSNLRSLGGNRCGMADSVLVETNTADSPLLPFVGSAAEGLAAANIGFTAQGVGELAPDGDGPGGPALPFGLDSARVPLLGSYTTGERRAASLTTQWYRLDLAAAQQDPAYRVVVLTIAGRIEGEQLRVEFADRAGDGTIRPLGELVPPSVAGTPRWRNLPIALDRVPEGTNAIRMIAADGDPAEQQWLAVTPPRLPHLATLSSLVGSRAPVLADSLVGLAFPCQRPFTHRHGVAELPVWRIAPDELNSQVAETWPGGPLGWTSLLTRPRTLPAYLEHDWTRDWGELQLLTPIVEAPPAALRTRTENEWGTANYGPIKAR
ncbi:arabinosyltransferase domain-containing protein [Nocardia sp. NPDC051832]|uniref:arabinosyltransferase domain-containing protein n=1 Tax=Nocardia sp. NPDC051832 TaxID=3155673 RepID=UPI0034380FDE